MGQRESMMQGSSRADCTIHSTGCPHARLVSRAKQSKVNAKPSASSARNIRVCSASSQGVRRARPCNDLRLLPAPYTPHLPVACLWRL
ncbi:hypothetical protein MHYP_G00225600 [Metynnis hypsauchen]